MSVNLALFPHTKLLEILTNSPVGLVISQLDGTVQYINPAFANMLGYTEEEMYQPELFVTHIDDLQINERMRDSLIRRPKTSVVMEKRYKHKSGTWVLGLTSMIALINEEGEPEHFVSQVIDIGYRKKIEKSADLFRTMVNASRDAMYIIDPESGRILDANLEGCQSLGYQYDEITNLNISDIEGNIFDPDGWNNYVATIREQTHLLVYGEHRHKDKHLFPVEVGFSYLVQGDVEYLLAIVRDITERKKSEELIWRQANYDTLTGLPNRNMLHDRLEQALKKAQRIKTKVAVLSLDLDRFKDVNDTLGHHIGDKLLKEVGTLIHNCVREMDTVARLGGDEFCVIIESVEDTAHVDRIANSIMQALAKPFMLEDHKVFTSTSIGISFYPDDGDNVDDLLKKSDQAMYFSKSKGRNCFQYFTSDMQEQALERMRISRDIYDAMQQSDFFVEYQPIISFENDEIYKAEALLRWQHPDRGLLNSAEFVAIAEENGTIDKISELVFADVLMTLIEWRKDIHPDFQISINASPLQFREGRNQLVNWKQALESNNLPGKSLLIEITEGMIMDTSESVTDKLLMLRDAGIQVALDDFGTGYSSLAYLQKLDIDLLKIDQSFVKTLSSASSEMALCEAIVVMAHRLKLKVVAEGIETEEQYRLLKYAGCDYGQGFYFSKSLNKKSFEKYFKHRELA